MKRIITGSLNIVARSLPCIPSALFEIHLGLTPAPLKSVPEEPPLPPAPPRKGKPADQETAWFEAQDLEVLKAFNNDIVEIQPELSLFGSLKVLDVRYHISSLYWGAEVSVRSMQTKSQSCL